MPLIERDPEPDLIGEGDERSVSHGNGWGAPLTVGALLGGIVLGLIWRALG